jgi:hypothetical protein
MACATTTAEQPREDSPRTAPLKRAMPHIRYDTDLHAWTRQQPKTLQENDWAVPDQGHLSEKVIIAPRPGAPP